VQRGRKSGYAPVEMTIWFEYSIPCFQERPAELQIPRLRLGMTKERATVA
jgi:hypothetical protein